MVELFTFEFKPSSYCAKDVMACLIVAEQKGKNLDYEQLKVHQNFLYSVYITAQKLSL